VLAGARAQVVCRGRYAEDRLADAVARGVEQYVILGAGLDSFAHRSGLADRVRIFEVDHPAAQEWKRRRTGPVPAAATLTYVAADLETDPLGDRLTATGCDPSRPAVVSWLGVSVYLTRAAIADTLAALGRFAPGTEVIADYLVPERLRDADGLTYAELVAPVAGQRGEPWLTFLTPDEMSTLLAEHGLEPVEHSEQRDAVPAALWRRSDALRPSNLARLVRARIPHSA
jgi:methyltransferase (TIGR00027 family)